jgi:hypothetical protein
VVRIGRASGQREDRYMHLLSGPVSIESLPAHVSRAESSSKDDRYTELEARIEALEGIVAELQARLSPSEANEASGLPIALLVARHSIEGWNPVLRTGPACPGHWINHGQPPPTSATAPVLRR